jgi:hypothetical protein
MQSVRNAYEMYVHEGMAGRRLEVTVSAMHTL